MDSFVRLLNHAARISMPFNRPRLFSPGSSECLRSANWLAFHFCLALVTLVSVHDAMLIVVNHEIINEVEENPIGRLLLQAQGGDVWLFVFAKLLGTSLVAAILITMYRCRKEMGLLCVSVLAFFQACLFGYLTL